MKIILLRHGIAVERGQINDNDRPLTKEGRAKLEKNLPYLKKYLKDETISVWSSDLTRAMETADVLMENWKVKECLTYPFIGTGNTSTLIRQLSQKEDDSTIIIIGHEPSLSDWVYYLTNHLIEMKKGGIAIIEYNKDEPTESKLIQDLRNKDLRRLLIKEQPKIDEILSENFQRIIAARKTFIRHPEEIESVHQLRVSIRRFRSLISSLKQQILPGQYKLLQDEFRQLGNECGKLREIDVLMMIWKERKKDTTYQESEELMDHFKSLRAKEEKSLHQIVSNEDFIFQLTKAYGRLLGALQTNGYDNKKLFHIILKQLVKWKKDITKGLKKKKKFDFPRVHRIRLKSKKYRYVCDIFKNYLPEKMKKEKQSAKQLQETLGDICDVIRNKDAIEELVSDELSDAITEQKNFFIGIEKEEEEKWEKRFEENISF